MSLRSPEGNKFNEGFELDVLNRVLTALAEIPPGEEVFYNGEPPIPAMGVDIVGNAIKAMRAAQRAAQEKK